MKRLYGLVGYDVSGSPTPSLMNRAFSYLGLDFIYSSFNAKSECEALEILFDYKLAGLNVTMPYKVFLFKYVEPEDDASRFCKSINTVKKENRNLGFNTDAYAALSCIREAGIGRVSKACLIGTGGVSRAFLYALKELHCKEIFIVSRNKDNFSKFEEFSGYFTLISAEPQEVREKLDIICNASPIGSMGFDTPEQLVSMISLTSLFFDAVYNPVETKLISEAKRLRKKVIHGASMLLKQAEIAFKIFTGLDAPHEIMEKELSQRLGYAL